MSGFLFPTLPFGPDELPTSFVSRLARLHRAPSAPAFCREVGLRLQLISDGDPDALAHLADLTGAPFEPLTANSIRRISAHVLTYRTEKLRKSCLYQSAQRICPSCLAEDCRRRPDLGELAGYGRSIWRLAALRTCPIHRTTLTNLPYETLERGLKFVRHDFCTLLTAAGIDPRSGPETHAETEPSSLERYLQQRLAGTEAEVRWLDHLPYYGVVKSCEIFGCVDRFGPKQILNDLDEDAWHMSGAAGFDILIQGPAGIRSFLQDLRERHRADRNRSRYAIYGPLYRWLRFEEDEPAFEELRDILTEHFICDVGPGSSRGIFGSNLPRRGISTIFSAAKDYRIDHRKLRRILDMNGLIAADHADHTADRVTFDLAAADPLLRDIATGLSLSSVASFLQTDRRDVVDLVATGLLRPLFHGGKRGSLLQIYIFRKADVEALMARLYASVGPPAPIEAQVHDLPGASHRARCSKFEIVELIASGKLSWVGARPGATSLNALLVDLKEVKRHLHAAFSDVVLVSEAAKILGIGTPDVRALVAQGFLRSAPLRHPRTRVLHDGIDRPSLKRFGKRYISSLRAAEQYKSKARHVMAAAAVHEIEIRFKCVRKNFAMYLRKDIRGIYSAEDRPLSGSRSARTRTSASPTMRAPPDDGAPRESD